MQALALHVRAQADRAATRLGLQPAARGPGLAAARQTVGDDQLRRGRVGDVLRQRQVAPSLGQVFVRFRRAGQLPRADRRHLGAHARPVARKKNPDGVRRHVAAGVGPLAQQHVRQPRLAVVQQVHPAEGHVAGHVDPAQLVVELDGVEGQHLAVDEDEVGQVQVAVAFAHPLLLPPPREQGLDGDEALLGPVAQRLHQRSVGGRLQHCAQGVEVVARPAHRRRRVAPGLGLAGHRRARLERRHAPRQPGDVLRRQRAAPAHMVQPRCLVEAAHLHRELHRPQIVFGAGLAPARIAWRADDGPHAQVDVGGRPVVLLEAPVHADLGLAGVAPRGQCAEVHEREAHRLLDLVGELARQQHPGAVRFRQLDAVDGVCVARRLQQRGDQRGQGVAHANHCKAAHPPAA